MKGIRRDVEFESQGTVCRAWLYEPAIVRSSVCVVMAHGFGLTRSAGLEPFAEAIARDGHRALLFDYRHFGASDGLPRQLVSLSRQLQDWRSAISFARRCTDAELVVTWGSSLGAGHAVTSAARDLSIAGVIALNPYVSGADSTAAAMSRWGLSRGLRILGTSLADWMSSPLGAAPIRVPVSAPSGEIGFLTQPDAYPGYLGIVPEDFEFEVCARVALEFWRYSPGRYIPTLGRPLLSFVCTQDTINRPEPAARLLERCRSASTVELDCHHMDIYLEPHRSRVVSETRTFLSELFV